MLLRGKADERRASAEVAEETAAEEAPGAGRLASGVRELCAAFGASSLVSLTLRDCALPEAAVALLAAAIGSEGRSSSLQTLVLDGNRAGVTGAVALATALGRGAQVATLRLSMNAIGDEGGAALGVALTRGCALTDLDVSKNQLGLTACALLFGLTCAGRTGLERLNVFGNRVGDTGTVLRDYAVADGSSSRGKALVTGETLDVATMFARGALLSPTLTLLDLGGNALGAASLLPICESYAAAAHTCSLRTLELFGNDYGEGAAAALAALRENLRERSAARPAGLGVCDVAWASIQDMAEDQSGLTVTE